MTADRTEPLSLGEHTRSPSRGPTDLEGTGRRPGPARIGVVPIQLIPCARTLSPDTGMSLAHADTYRHHSSHCGMTHPSCGYTYRPYKLAIVSMSTQLETVPAQTRTDARTIHTKAGRLKPPNALSSHTSRLLPHALLTLLGRIALRCCHP